MSVMYFRVKHMNTVPVCSKCNELPEAMITQETPLAEVYDGWWTANGNIYCPECAKEELNDIRLV